MFSPNARIVAPNFSAGNVQLPSVSSAHFSICSRDSALLL
jgi:hypothetical protein